MNRNSMKKKRKKIQRSKNSDQKNMKNQNVDNQKQNSNIEKNNYKLMEHLGFPKNISWHGQICIGQMVSYLSDNQ